MKPTKLLTVVAVSALALSACGKSGGTNNAADTTGTTAASSVTTVASAATTAGSIGAMKYIDACSLDPTNYGGVASFTTTAFESQGQATGKGESACHYFERGHATPYVAVSVSEGTDPGPAIQEQSLNFKPIAGSPGAYFSDQIGPGVVKYYHGGYKVQIQAFGEANIDTDTEKQAAAAVAKLLVG